MNCHPLILSCLLLSALSTAQRATADLSWKKHDIAVEYGPVRVGKHSLDELAVGQEWRMGSNTASLIRLDVPLVAGDAVAAPGSYRVKLLRKKDRELMFNFEGAGHSLGANSANVYFPGELSEPKGKAPKKLELSWDKPKVSSLLLTSALHVRFGPTSLEVPIQAVDGVQKKGKRFTLNLFAWSAEVLEQRTEAKLSTPIATLTLKKKPKKGQPSVYNLILTPDGARLIPQMSAPTDRFGFGNVVPPAEDRIVDGTAEWTEGQATKKAEQLTLASYTDSKKEIVLEVVCGEKRATLKFTTPGK